MELEDLESKLKSLEGYSASNKADIRGAICREFVVLNSKAGASDLYRKLYEETLLDNLQLKAKLQVAQTPSFETPIVDLSPASIEWLTEALHTRLVFTERPTE